MFFLTGVFNFAGHNLIRFYEDFIKSKKLYLWAFQN